MIITTIIAVASVLSFLCAFQKHPVSVTGRSKEQGERISGADAKEVEMEQRQ